VWLEPYPDQAIGVPAGKATPEARYEQHESIELAFVASLQHLAANQRAVLILREVLGFSAHQTAEMLSTTVASVNSALQRARAAVSSRIPERTQQASLRMLGDHGLRDLVGRYVDAWERCDVDAFAALLVQDASFAMPPLATWYAPRDSIVAWARAYAMSGEWRWRTVLTQANAQPALAFYAWDESAGVHLPFALNVLTLRDDLIGDVTAFIVRATDAVDAESYIRFPEQPFDQQRLSGTFERFGLPHQLN
jgi:RNA polymerase sigma-70 factor (ECF subfamily)